MLSTDIHSSSDARRIAKKRLPWMVFDYIDGAAGDEIGEALSREAIQQIRLQPRILNNVEHRDLSVEVFGVRAKLPFGISPMGMCNLAAPGADLMLAQMAAKDHIPLGASTAASTSLEKIIEAAEGHAWFQLYFGGDEAVSSQLMNRAEKAGYKTLVLTVDVPEVGRRPRELQRGFKMPFKLGVPQLIDFALHPRWSLPTLINGRPELANFGGKYGEFDRAASRAGADWEFLDRIRSNWKGNLVVKGVLDIDDALRLKRAGVDAIQVSSHGARQMDSAPPPVSVLRRMREALGEGFPIFYDTGIRSGEDIVKAYALGADFVFLGRPMLFSIAAGGARGLQQMRDVFAEETSITLAQLGLVNMHQISEGNIC
ncbi:MAG: alpha-hydroxy-acid oxidizing protein [Proteobacteria bacterium]|nr:alpha-hydroxy-acid oxidizing protein [Pseudomonadota bacterium]